MLKWLLTFYAIIMKISLSTSNRRTLNLVPRQCPIVAQSKTTGYALGLAVSSDSQYLFIANGSNTDNRKLFFFIWHINFKYFIFLSGKHIII